MAYSIKAWEGRVSRSYDNFPAVHGIDDDILTIEPESDLASLASLASFKRALAQAQDQTASLFPFSDPTWNKISNTLGFATAVAGAYHGYKRNCGSIGWAIGWSLLGVFWPITLPVMIAQGVGKAKPTCR